VRPGPILLVVAALVGGAAGLGLFTFGYAEGLSYFSSDPRACANCHVMNDQYASWGRSTHHAAARCVDCHLPSALLPKLLAKASNGWHHSKGFTLEDFHEPIMIKPKNAQILQDNCLRCHGALVHELVAGATTERDAVRCVHCHVHVGHGGRP
jgi:cytochrome c nitrite reductase small subunit